MYPGNLSKQNCSDKDFPRVANKCSHLDTLRGGNMKHEPWSKTHTSTWCAHGANHRRWKNMMKWNFQHLRRCTTINNPHAHNNYRDPLQTTMKRKIRIQLVRGMNPITTNKNTMQSSQEQTRSTIKKHTDTGTQRFRPRKWCQNDTTNRSRRNHLRNCLRKKPSRSDYIIDTQTKTRWQKNHFAKRWQTEPSHAQLVFHRDHTCIKDTTKQTHNKSTNTYPASHWKTKCQKWPFLTNDSQNNTHLWPAKSGAIEILKNCLTKIPTWQTTAHDHHNQNQNDKKTVAIMTYRKYDVLGFPATSWHLGDAHNHQTIKPQHNAVCSELHNILHL